MRFPEVRLSGGFDLEERTRPCAADPYRRDLMCAFGRCRSAERSSQAAILPNIDNAQEASGLCVVVPIQCDRLSRLEPGQVGCDDIPGFARTRQDEQPRANIE